MFNLLPTSPCRDAGDPRLPLDPDETIADMGALTYLPSAVIAMSTTQQLFGMVQVGQSMVLPLTVYNVGELTLVIYDVYTSNPCYITDYNQADSLIEGGEGLTINVTFTPVEAGPYIETLTIENNDQTVNVGLLGVGEGSAVIEPDSPCGAPCKFELLPPYPNPFNPETVLSYSLPYASQVRLSVYDVTGREVAQLVNGGKAAGTHERTFDALHLVGGVYIAKLTAGEFQQAQKLLLVK